jgi:hypothetical protein
MRLLPRDVVHWTTKENPIFSDDHPDYLQVQQGSEIAVRFWEKSTQEPDKRVGLVFYMKAVGLRYEGRDQVIKAAVSYPPQEVHVVPTLRTEGPGAGGIEVMAIRRYEQQSRMGLLMGPHMVEEAVGSFGWLPKEVAEALRPYLYEGYKMAVVAHLYTYTPLINSEYPASYHMAVMVYGGDEIEEYRDLEDKLGAYARTKRMDYWPNATLRAACVDLPGYQKGSRCE